MNKELMDRTLKLITDIMQDAQPKKVLNYYLINPEKHKSGFSDISEVTTEHIKISDNAFITCANNAPLDCQMIYFYDIE